MGMLLKPHQMHMQSGQDPFQLRIPARIDQRPIEIIARTQQLDRLRKRRGGSPLPSWPRW